MRTARSVGQIQRDGPWLKRFRAFVLFQIGGHFSGSVTGDGNGAEGWGMEALEGWIMEMLALVAGETGDKRSLRLGCCYS